MFTFEREEQILDLIEDITLEEWNEIKQFIDNNLSKVTEMNAKYNEYKSIKIELKQELNQSKIVPKYETKKAGLLFNNPKN